MVKAAYLYGQVYAAHGGIGIIHPKSRAESSKKFKCSIAPSSVSSHFVARRITNLGLRIAADLRILQGFLNRPQTLVETQHSCYIKAVNISNGALRRAYYKRTDVGSCAAFYGP
jgi:hypothetical protein